MLKLKPVTFIVLISFLLLSGALLLISYFTADEVSAFFGWGILIFGLIISVFTLIPIRIDSDGSGFSGPMLAEVGIGSDKAAFLAAHAGSTSYSAEVLKQVNTGTELGTGRFGTVLELRVSIGEAEQPGAVREFLTPAQIAQTVPGSKITVKPVDKYPGLFVVVFN